MLKKFLITDGCNIDYGVLTYDSDRQIWHIDIAPERNWEDTPLSLAIYIRTGKFSLDERESLAWVQDRIVPPNRQNINQLLNAANLDEYDEYGLIRKTSGVSPNDALYLIEQN